MRLAHKNPSKCGPSISNIKIQNFKSFKNLDISLNKFNVIIGANATGKSNFTQIFNFLKDISSYGLDNAISQQGGLEYLRNINVGSNQNLLFEITFKFPQISLAPLLALGAVPSLLPITKATYRFEIKLQTNSKFTIIDDKWSLNVDVYADDDEQYSKKQASGKVVIKNKRGKVEADTTFPPNIQITSKDIILSLISKTMRPKSLLIENPFFNLILLGLGRFFSETKVYDFDLEAAKQATLIKGKVELDNNGANLAIVLKNTLKNKERRREFFNLITNLLPVVSSVDTKKFGYNSILFMLKESYFKQSLPSTLLSNGTINITALILALHFQPNILIVIEEPERSIHPSLLSGVVEMMKEASNRRQIIITTHNPEMVRYAEIKNILTVKRGADGYSEIIKPSDQDEIKNFLENDMKIEDLYVQNLLGD